MAFQRPAKTLRVASAHVELAQLDVLTLSARLERYEWLQVHETLDADGIAVLPSLLDTATVEAIANSYGRDELFRSRVIMQRHNYGRGEYKYFAAPLLPVIQILRQELYARLVPLANRWAQGSREMEAFPECHADFVKRCHRAGQTRPTPLVLRYSAGDYNCLHQDLYGGVYFPLQVAVLLSDPDRDFDGGELVLTEQRPRMQSRARVVPLQQGDAAVFAVNHRPVRGTRGTYRVTMRHGVSTITRGERYTLGIIFHDAT